MSAVDHFVSSRYDCLRLRILNLKLSMYSIYISNPYEHRPVTRNKHLSLSQMSDSAGPGHYIARDDQSSFDEKT
jgi:hypothetical protein